MANYATPLDGLPEAVAAEVIRCSCGGRVLLSSFNPIALRRMRHLLPEVLMGLLVSPKLPAWQRALFPRLARFDLLHAQEQLIRGGWPASQPRARRRIVAWTVNDGGRIAELVRQEVEGIITDVPDVARAIVERVHAGG